MKPTKRKPIARAVTHALVMLTAAACGGHTAEDPGVSEAPGTSGWGAGGGSNGGARETPGPSGAGGASAGRSACGEEAGQGGNTTLDPTGNGGAGPCPKIGGPSMVFLPEGYCIDSTEVTRGQYQAWLDSNPFTDGQRSECAFNTDFAPDAHCMGQADPSADCPSHPVVCVDWCDANAYCQAVGKRLCGKIGGGAYPFYDLKNMGQSQWYQACISGGANNIYPYGNTYRASACNGRDYQESLHPGRFTTVPVASMPQCQSAILGYQGVFDLSGNVEELQDSCDAGGEYTGLDCETRGGYFFHADMFLDCSQSFSQPIQIGSSEIGFRCCFP